MKDLCPRCGSVAQCLLNLVDCVTQTCKNYSREYAQVWRSQNTKRWSHHDDFHKFLGVFVYNTTHYDIYHFVNDKSKGVCFVRFGNFNEDCFYVDDAQTEVGNLAAGPVEKVNSSIQAALKEALQRSRRK